MINLKCKSNNERIKLILVLLFFSFSVLIGVYIYNLRYIKVNFDEANKHLYLKKQFSGNVIDKKTSKNKSTILVLNNGTEVLTVPHFVVNVKLGDSISKKENDSLAYIYSRGQLRATFNYLNFKTSQ